jgi:NadR type nicotinamide-nucleotide adenylyltransferase
VGASRFDRGLVLGGFLPPHVGHHALIRHVQTRFAQVVIAVTDRPGQLPGTHDRASWMQAVHLDLDVVVLPDTCEWHGSAPCIDDCASAWADQVALLPAPFDLLVTADPFGPLLAERLGATYLNPSTLISADPGLQPIVGSTVVVDDAVRRDLAGHWDRLHPVVRAGLYRRLALIGSESTGTTTLARDLADHLGAPLTYEAGRIMSWSLAARVGGIEKVEWTEHDFFRILEEQRRVEADATARAVDLPIGALGPWLVCDTDALATVVWWERYLDGPPDPSMRFSDARLADAYVITSPPDVSFLQDGVRDGEHVRFAMHARFVELAAASGRPYLEVSGTEAERLERVLEWLADVEAARPRLASGA